MSETVHTVPTFGREHNTNGLHCWCAPEYRTPCEECDGESCWKCGGAGTLPVERPDEHDGPFGLMVIHNAPDTSHGR